MKYSKREADYVPSAATQNCKDCTMFRSPSSCTLVTGAISPQGHCHWFERRVATNNERQTATNHERATTDTRKNPKRGPNSSPGPDPQMPPELADNPGGRSTPSGGPT